MSIQNPDVVVIGAGAAGIGAGVALTRLGLPFTILEAKDRLGGRAYSENHSLGHLWDHGCHWFHSADINPLRMIADRIGHRYRAGGKAPLIKTFMDGKWEDSTLRDHVWHLLGEVTDLGKTGKDVAASTLLDSKHPLYPMIRHWLTLMYSVDAEEISTLDAARYNDTYTNYPVRDGYGALVAKLGARLPVRFGAAVRHVEAMPGGVRIDTGDGTLQAKSAILAVPSRMLETGRLTIGPELPARLSQALDDVPMGWYEKIAFAFDRPVFEGFDPPYADIFDPVAPTTHPLNFELHPFGRPIAITHIAGDLARSMERRSEAEMKAFALDTLVRAFGADLRKRVVRSAATHWSSDPHINGAYACAKPGKADQRKVFLEPVHDRIFLAGEHTHQSFNATAHGAYLSGIDAAHRAAELIGARKLEPDPLWLAA